MRTGEGAWSYPFWYYGLLVTFSSNFAWHPSSFAWKYKMIYKVDFFFLWLLKFVGVVLILCLLVMGRKIAMATGVAARTSNFHFGGIRCKGQSCQQASLVSSLTFNGCIQRELSWYLIRIFFWHWIFAVNLFYCVEHCLLLRIVHDDLWLLAISLS